MAYNRYSKFTSNGTIDLVPFVEIKKMPSDFYVYHNKETRLDMLSYEYYGDPNYGWLIMQANPCYGSLEFNIPENALLRIPFPLELAITNYNDGIKKYKLLYGN